MTALIVTPLAIAGGILLISRLFAGIETDGLYPALISALLLTILNASVKPVILFFTFPINFITLGLFSLILNGVMLWFVALVVDGFHVAGFVPAVSGAFVLSVIMILWRELVG